MLEPISTMNSELQVATALRHLALNEDVKAYVLEHSPLYQVLLHAAMRFIGGETLDRCIEAAKLINQQGFAVTIDYMGESTREVETAERATQEFLEVIQAVEAHKLDSSVSLDLSHIGMAITTELGYKNACRLAEAAQDAGLEIMLSMEGINRTDSILEIYQQLCSRFDNVGITLQAYLYRTPDDLATVMNLGKIRLVKGAFEAPVSLTMMRGTNLDSAYRQLMEILLASGHPCSIATHDLDLLDQARRFIQQQGIKPDKIEFEMLKGVTLERLQAMRESGYRTRVYLPYGKEWYLYLCNRLAEYPPNIYQAVTDAVEANSRR